MNQKSKALEEKLAESWTGSRVLSLTDNIFAFAMTLLILNFLIPQDLPSENMTQLFVHLWPQFLTYFMSFAVLGTFWIGQHNILHLTKHVDRMSVWIQLVFSSFIVLVPLTTGILRNYYMEPISILIYGSDLVIAGLATYWFWHHVVTNGLLQDGVTSDMVSLIKLRILVPVTGAIIVTGVGLIAPLVSLFLFAVLFMLVTAPINNDILVSLIERLSRKKSLQ